MKSKRWSILIIALLLAFAGCGKKPRIEESVGKEFRKVISAESLQETKVEEKRSVWNEVSKQILSWDRLHDTLAVKDDTIFRIKGEWTTSGLYHQTIVSMDREGNMIREIPVDCIWDEWMICDGFLVEDDGSFVMVLDTPDSLNSDDKKEAFYVEADSEGNVILKQNLNELMEEDTVFITGAAFAGNGWKCATAGKTLLWNDDNEFMGIIDAYWVVSSRSGDLYSLRKEGKTYSFSKVETKARTFCDVGKVNLPDSPCFLQPGIEKEFLALDRTGVMEFNPGEEPVYLVKYEDHGLERMNIHGLYVQGTDILLLEEQKMDTFLWRFRKNEE